jgi:hypothetical protein
LAEWKFLVNGINQNPAKLELDEVRLWGHKQGDQMFVWKMSPNPYFYK